MGVDGSSTAGFNPGMSVELEIENIGVLRNRIGEPEVNPAEWTEKGL